MTTIEALQSLRAQANAALPVFFAFDLLPEDPALRTAVVGILETVFVPASAMQRRALERGDGFAAVAIAAAPGADRQLWEAMESWSYQTVIRGLDRCILKAKGVE